VSRPRTTALAGVAAALLCNYWVLEGLLADRYDLDSSWISDLATRSESSGARFVAFGIASGLAIAGFALLLVGPLGGRSRTLRLGVNALLATGAMVVVASAAPLDCAEGLEPTCTLAYDPLDVIHVAATTGEIIATILAFLLIGLGLLDQRIRFPSRIAGSKTESRTSAGEVTLALGVVWVVVTALTGVTYLGDAIDGVKGLLQRADQVLFGVWLVLLGVWTGDLDRTSDSGSR
jgi:hypothetical protein